MVYVPLAQAPAAAVAIAHQVFPATWIVRTRPGAGEVSQSLEEIVRRLDGSLAFVRVRPMAEIVREDVQGAEFLAQVITALAVLALAIAATGVFGLVAYSAHLRRRETAIRVALGASRSSLIRAFLRETSLITGIGVGAGVVATLATTRVLTAALGDNGTVGVASLVVSSLILALVLGVSGLVPALRASRVDPLATLRE
jgi:ABC-type antimicrobial peptide transport system permease subunit